MASIHIVRGAAAASSVVVLNTVMRYCNKNDDHDMQKVVCEAGGASSRQNNNNTNNNNMDQSKTYLEMQKQQQRIGRKLYSGEGDSQEEQELLNLLDSVKDGDLSAEDGIEKVRQAMFGKFEQTYATHICGSYLEGWHTCFFDKMVEKKTVLSDNNENEPENHKNESNVLLQCKDPFLLGLQSCMYQQTEKVKEIIKANMGEEAYDKWYAESKRNTLRKILAASSSRNPKEIEDSELDPLYEQSKKNRLQLETELNAFAQRQQQLQKKQPPTDLSANEGSDSPEKSWWKSRQ